VLLGLGERVPVGVVEQVREMLRVHEGLPDSVMVLVLVAVTEALLEQLNEELGAEAVKEGDGDGVGEFIDAEGLLDQVSVALALWLSPLTLALPEAVAEFD